MREWVRLQPLKKASLAGYVPITCEKCCLQNQTPAGYVHFYVTLTTFVRFLYFSANKESAGALPFLSKFQTHKKTNSCRPRALCSKFTQVSKFRQILKIPNSSRVSAQKRPLLTPVFVHASQTPAWYVDFYGKP